MTKLKEIDLAICKKLPIFRDFSPEVRLSVCRAALEAMKEPTSGQLAASRPAFRSVDPLLEVAAIFGATLVWENGEPPIIHAYRAMIRAALDGK